MSDELRWTPEQMLEVTINKPDDFLKIRETSALYPILKTK